jgi:hypothetical protein
MPSPPWLALLKADPTDWLLEESNPPVRHLTLTQLLDRPADSPEVLQSKQAVWSYAPVQQLLAALEANPLDLDTLARFGVPRGHPAIDRACDHHLQQDLDPGPKCYPHQTIGGLVRYADPADPRLQTKIDFVLHNQPLFDGNRPGTKLRYGTRDVCCGSHSCFSAVARSLWAVAGLPPDKRSPEVRAFLARGADFLAAHRLYQSNHRDFKPIKREWLRLHLPFALGWRTDLLDLLDIATQIGLQADPSLADAVQFVLSKQNHRGRWTVEESFRRHYADRLGTLVKDMERVGEESKWITLHALTQLKRSHSLASAVARGDAPQPPPPPSEEPEFADYPFPYQADDEARVRRQWEDLALTPILDRLLAFARVNDLHIGWHWGLAFGPPHCPEWCSASVRHVPSKTMKQARRVGRICFLTPQGKHSTSQLARRLHLPPAFDWPKPPAAWVKATLWRVGVEPWKSDYDEVGVALTDAPEFDPLRPLLQESLSAVRQD